MINSAGVRTAIEAGVASGLVFNASAFEWAIKNSRTYDASIRRKLEEGFIGEDLFLELAVEDARKAADHLRFIYDETDGADGWVSLDVSPRAFNSPTHLAKAVVELYGRVRRPNAMIKVPGTKEGNLAVVEAVSVGVPVYITNIFSTKQFSSAVEAYCRGVEQRLKTGLELDPGSAVSLCIDPWETERIGKGSIGFSSQDGVAIFHCTYKRWRALVQSTQWNRLCREGVRPLRLLCKGVEINTPETLKALTVKKLATPLTVFTMYEKRSNKSAAGKGNYRANRADEKDSEKVPSRAERSVTDIEHWAKVFQKDAVSLFVKKWFDLMTTIAHKSATLIQVDNECKTKN